MELKFEELIITLGKHFGKSARLPLHRTQLRRVKHAPNIELNYWVSHFIYLFFFGRMR